MRQLPLILPSTLGLAVLALLAVPAFADPAPRTLSVDGRGEVTAAPDTAFVHAGVTTSANTAREALTANSQAMADTIAAIKAQGIEGRDIQTSGFSVNPQYVYPDRDADGSTPPPRLTGYQVQNGVDVRVRKVDTLGTVLDQIVSVGANSIGNVSFSVDNPKPLLDEARKAAFADAEAKARIYAGAAGVTLGNVLSISEGGGVAAPQPMMRMAAAPLAEAPAVPVEAGQLTYDVDVSVQWELKGGAP